MYLHLGGQTVLNFNDIIAIINLEKNSKLNKEFIEIAQLNKNIKRINNQDKIKTCIISNENIFLTSISSVTLAKRIENYNKNLR